MATLGQYIASRYFMNKECFRRLSDELYLKIVFKLMTGKKLNLLSPITFNEKMQWLKLNDRKSEYTMMVDKYEVKKYISGKIGNEFIIPLLGVWDNFEDIDFNNLPAQFVIKCTHDSGGLVICKDKTKIDYQKMKEQINKCLNRNFFWVGREWPYKDVTPRIIAEKYISVEDKDGLDDYKFFCFNGEPKFLYLSRNLTQHEEARISYVTLDWKEAPFYRKDYQRFEELPPKPFNFSKMIEFSKLLSKNIPFVRVDFYEINNILYFGELTFTPGSGFTEFYPDEWNKYWGDMLEIKWRE